MATISDDHPDENREIICRIIPIMKNNVFKETRHILPINIYRNHLSHYLPVILLDGDLNNQNYTITLTDEVGNRRSFCNFRNETKLKSMFKIFLKRHEDSQNGNKITAIPSKTNELIKSRGIPIGKKFIWKNKTNNIS